MRETCERHNIDPYYDTFGLPICPKCLDEAWENYYRHLTPGHNCDKCSHWAKWAKAGEVGGAEKK